jgi:hypothetical protein
MPSSIAQKVKLLSDPYVTRKIVVILNVAEDGVKDLQYLSFKPARSAAQ